MADRVDPMLLMIADISGYTKYLVRNANELAHAQLMLTSLLEAVLHRAKLPLQIAKIEGDAVFMYALAGDPTRWSRDRLVIRSRLAEFQRLFGERVQLLQAHNSCQCGACQNLSSLTIKFIVHFGQALQHRVGRYRELAGPDVILLHRLLKNSVPERSYVLATAAADRELELSQLAPLQPLTENVEEFGEVALVWTPELPRTVEPAPTGLRGWLAAKMALMWAMLRAGRRTFRALPVE